MMKQRKKPSTPARKRGSLENVGGGDERKGFLIVVLLFNADSWVFYILASLDSCTSIFGV